MLASSLHNRGDSLHRYFIGNVVTTMHIANKIVIETVNVVVKRAGQNSGPQAEIEILRALRSFFIASVGLVFTFLELTVDNIL